MIVYIVVGGCIGDEHIIAVYRNEEKANKRANKENKECHGLDAHVEAYEISK